MIEINFKRLIIHWKLIFLFLGLLGSTELVNSAPTSLGKPKERMSSLSSPGRTSEQDIGSPSELAWQAWLLVDTKSGLSSGLDSASILRRITPKSVFIAPQLQACAEGYKADNMGRCQKIVNIDQEAHFNFLVQRLNQLYGKGSQATSSNTDKRHQSPIATGPLQLNIPLLPNTRRDESTSLMMEDDAELPQEAIPLDTKTEEPIFEDDKWNNNNNNNTKESSEELEQFPDFIFNSTTYKIDVQDSSSELVLPVADFIDEANETYHEVMDYKIPESLESVSMNSSGDGNPEETNLKKDDDLVDEDESTTTDFLEDYFSEEENSTFPSEDYEVIENTTVTRYSSMENVTESPYQKIITDIESEMEAWRNQSDALSILVVRKNETGIIHMGEEDEREEKEVEEEGGNGGEREKTREGEGKEDKRVEERADGENEEGRVEKKDEGVEGNGNEKKSEEDIGEKRGEKKVEENKGVTEEGEEKEREGIEVEKEVIPDLEDLEYFEATEFPDEDSEYEILKHGETSVTIPIKNQIHIRLEEQTNKQKEDNSLKTNTFHGNNSEFLSTATTTTTTTTITTKLDEDTSFKNYSEASVNKDLVLETILMKNSSESVPINNTRSKSREVESKVLPETEKRLMTEPEVVLTSQDDEGSGSYGRKRDGQQFKTNFQFIRVASTTVKSPTVSSNSYSPRLEDDFPQEASSRSEKFDSVESKKHFPFRPPELDPKPPDFPNAKRKSDTVNRRGQNSVRFPVLERSSPGYVRFPSDNVNSIHSPEMKQRFPYTRQEFSSPASNIKSDIGFNQKQSNWWAPLPSLTEERHQTFMQSQISSNQNPMLLRFWSRMPLLKDPSLNPGPPEATRPFEQQETYLGTSRISPSRRMNFYSEASSQGLKDIFNHNSRSPIEG